MKLGQNFIKYFVRFGGHIMEFQEKKRFWDLLTFAATSWKLQIWILDKILPYEARAEFYQIFRSYWEQWSFKKKCFLDLLTFAATSCKLQMENHLDTWTI